MSKDSKNFSRDWEPRIHFDARSPLAQAEAIAPIIDGKIVCDIGCSYGDLMLAFMDYGAKEVFGIDINEERVNACIERGLDARLCNVLEEPIPKADVYYLWIWPGDELCIIEKIDNAIIIIGDHTKHPDVYIPGIPIDLYHEERGYREKWRFNIIQK